MPKCYRNIKLVCTGTTGSLIQKAFEEKGVSAEVICMNSGPMGGDAEIAALGGS